MKIQRGKLGGIICPLIWVSNQSAKTRGGGRSYPLPHTVLTALDSLQQCAVSPPTLSLESAGLKLWWGKLCHYKFAPTKFGLPKNVIGTPLLSPLLAQKGEK